MLWEIGRRMGISITYDGKQDLGLERIPTRDELFEIRLRGSRFTLDALKALPSGIVVDSPELEVQPARAGVGQRCIRRRSWGVKAVSGGGSNGERIMMNGRRTERSRRHGGRPRANLRKP